MDGALKLGVQLAELSLVPQVAQLCNRYRHRLGSHPAEEAEHTQGDPGGGGKGEADKPDASSGAGLDMVRTGLRVVLVYRDPLHPTALKGVRLGLEGGRNPLRAPAKGSCAVGIHLDSPKSLILHYPTLRALGAYLNGQSSLIAQLGEPLRRPGHRRSTSGEGGMLRTAQVQQHRIPHTASHRRANSCDGLQHMTTGMTVEAAEGMPAPGQGMPAQEALGSIHWEVHPYDCTAAPSPYTPLHSLPAPPCTPHAALQAGRVMQGTARLRM